MSAVTASKLLTAEEFANLPRPMDGSRQELERGEIVTMAPPRFVHGKVQGRVYYALETYNRTTKFGHVITETGVITEEDPDTVRGPDVAVWSYTKVPIDREPRVYAEVAPDLCVEVLSPSNTKSKMTTKIREYFDSGVRMVWVVDPESRMVTVYRKPGEGRELWEDASISGEDVLPDFSCPIAEFFS